MSGSNIGKRIFIAQAAPATNDAVGFGALTWVEVKGQQVLPQLGVSHANIDVPDLATGFTTGLKGAGSGNDSTMSFHLVDGDSGQTNLRTNANAGGSASVTSIKMVKGSGDVDADNIPAVESGDPVEYAHGYVHSYIENQGDNTTYEGFSVSFKQNALTIKSQEA